VLRAFALALAQLGDRAFRRPLVLGLVGALGIFIALWAGLWVVLTRTTFLEIGWLETALDALGGLAALALTVVLYPAVAAAVTSLLLDSTIAAVESRHYPGLPPPRRVGFGEQAWAALRLLALAVFLNLLMLPVYFLPAINLVVFYGLNGYILGREYLETVASRRLDPPGIRRLWSDHRMTWVASGAVIALVSTIPVINLIAPLVGAAAMTHQVARLGWRSGDSTSKINDGRARL
jgi:uncharacterized protein involved in cysteine biosynthesis